MSSSLKKIGLLIKKKTETNEETSPSPPPPEDLDFPSENYNSVVAKSKLLNDPLLDEQVMESISKEFFQSEEDFDAVEYQLKQLPENLDLQYLNQQQDKYKQQLQVVSKKISGLILDNEAGYANELSRVSLMEATLDTTYTLCLRSRHKLSEATKRLTLQSVKLLVNHRKKSMLVSLIKAIKALETLEHTDANIMVLLESEEYPRAIQLCLECQKTAITYKYYKCISELSSKLSDTLVTIEEQLDQTLAKNCSSFNPLFYGNLNQAYHILGKEQTAVDQMLMHFAGTIHNTAFQIVVGYVELYSGKGDSSHQRLSYNQLCRHIDRDAFMPCLSDLCRSLWNIMLNYYKLRKWHRSHSSGVSGKSVESNFTRNYIDSKLEYGTARIWQDIQNKVKFCVLGTDLSSFLFDDFIKVLDVIAKLIAIGDEFCGKSASLRETLHKQSLDYFLKLHRGYLDELSMFLENEAWQWCPVKASFNAVHLKEFNFLIEERRSDSVVDAAYLESFEASDATPFDLPAEVDYVEDVFSTSRDELDESDDSAASSESDDVPDELKAAFIDEEGVGSEGAGTSGRERRPSGGTRRTSSEGKQLGSRQSSTTRRVAGDKVLANTSLSVLRSFGRYMRMMSLLKTIAFEVVVSMTQLYELYLFSVNLFFAADADDKTAGYSTRLLSTLTRIYQSLIANNSGAVEDGGFRVEPPGVSPLVDLTDSTDLFGLQYRIVATESLVLLSEELTNLRPHIESMLPENRVVFFNQFCAQTLVSAGDLRGPIYGAVADRIVNAEQIVSLIAQVRWDIGDIMSQHNAYVDVVLSNLQGLECGLAATHRDKVPVLPAVSRIIWGECLKSLHRTLVEGYSSVRKCSNEGRALMQLDFQQYVVQVERLTDVRPLPMRDLVEAYIKAFYLPEIELEKWLKEHRESYTTKQLVGLVNCLASSHLTKKAKQRLLSMLEAS